LQRETYQDLIRQDCLPERLKYPVVSGQWSVV